MRTFLFTLLFAAFSGLVSAQGCASAPAVISSLNKKLVSLMQDQGCRLTGPTYASQCLTSLSKYDKISQEMVKHWNGNQRNWSNIGPRRLDFGKTSQGRLVSTGGRMFISSMPAKKNEMTVTLNEIDGKGKTSFAVCKVDRYGNYIKLRTGWFNDSGKRKSNKREKRSFTIKGVKGHLISVHLDGKSVGNTFQYQLKVR